MYGTFNVHVTSVFVSGMVLKMNIQVLHIDKSKVLIKNVKLVVVTCYQLAISCSFHHLFLFIPFQNVGHDLCGISTGYDLD